MTDHLTVLRAVSGARMTKLWKADGTIEGYENAKTFITKQIPVSSLEDLAGALDKLSGHPSWCIIRGSYDVPKGTRVLRDTESTTDTPHHWMMIDVDNFEPVCTDSSSQFESAIQEFIETCLPPEFQEVSCYFRASASAGAPGKESLLKAHLWYWLDGPLDSTTLRAWAKTVPGIDPAVYRQVQAHYTADPVRELGAPRSALLSPRSGIHRGTLSDTLTLDLTKVAPLPETAGAIDLDAIRDAVPGWDIDRVENELLPKLDPNMHHDDWVQVGMALHHQFGGSDEALDLWDRWSSDGLSWNDQVCAQRWPSFKPDRSAGHGAITLRAVLRMAGLRASTADDEFEAEERPEANVGSSGQPPTNDNHPPGDGSDDPEEPKRREPGTGHAERFLFGLERMLGTADVGAAIDFSAKRFDRALTRLAWDAARSQFKLMTFDGLLLLANREDTPELLREHGMLKFYDVEKLETLVNASPNLPQAALARERWVKIALFAPVRHLLHLARAHRQFSNLNATVEMFAKRGGMRVHDDTLTLVYPHEPFLEGPVDQAVINDYRAHFPQFDDFLAFLAAARFATDRKTAHLWLHAESNWGKSFLMGMLKPHGLVMETSVAEIEKVLAGGPAGLTLAAMRRIWVLAVDEFKGVTRELKQLGTEINFSPKNQARVTVPLYAKVFMSAEDVPSLVSDVVGAEDQFIKRFMKLSSQGDLAARALYRQSQARYVASVKNFIAVDLNRRVAEYRASGPVAAADRADGELARLHKAWPLMPNGGRTLQDNLADLTQQFMDDMIRAFEQIAERGSGFARNDPIARIASGNVLKKGDCYFLQRSAASLEEWTSASFPRSEAGLLKYKRTELMKFLGETKLVRFPDGVAKVREIRASEENEPWMQ